MPSNTQPTTSVRPRELTLEDLNALPLNQQPVQGIGANDRLLGTRNSKNGLSRGFDPLGALFPRTMSAFARDPNYAAALNQQANLHNITGIGAAAAASPYLLGLGTGAGIEALAGVRATANGYKALNPILKGGLGGAGVASVFNARSQFRNGATRDTFDYNQNLKAGAIGGLTGVFGAGLATAAGVTPVSGLNLLGNLKNPAGLVIFSNAAMMNHAGQKAVKSSKGP